MINRSRSWAALAVALAMVLTTGLGVGGPAAAAPGSVDLAETAEATGSPDLGAMLSVSYEAQPDGFIRTTAYENTTVTEIQAASCQITVSANKPVKSGTRIRGSGDMKLGSGCTGAWQVLLHVQIYSIDWIAQTTMRQTVYAPYSAYFSTSTACKKGQWRSEIIVQKGSNDAASRSSVLTVSSC